ncbi:hypothetical protein BDV93DRAFT_51834 [Ceratobasidium sp. AG-I]|nr:hypothetical protein BDV93DRAFT_51834 [Ceratobasidium sp. AG-I]
MINAEDLVANTRPLSHSATWRGDSRQKHLSPKAHVRFFARWMSAAGKYIFNPAETRLYALCQHILALAAIALILTRIVVLMTQLENEEFQTRSGFQKCSQAKLGTGLSLIVGHSEDRGINLTLAKQEFNATKYHSQVEVWLGDVKSTSRLQRDCRQIQWKDQVDTQIKGQIFLS